VTGTSPVTPNRVFTKFEVRESLRMLFRIARLLALKIETLSAQERHYELRCAV
jgi:hypothetical protein